MKREISVLLAALVLFLAVQVSAASAQPSEISLDLNRQTPYPVRPGETVSLELTMLNEGSTSKGITLEIIPKAPFTLLPGVEAKKTFSRIGALSSVTETYKLKVDGTAVSAAYDIEFRYYITGSTTSITRTFPVTVEGTPKIVIDEIITDPAVIEPGNEVELTLKLRNAGTGRASHMEMNIEAEADSETGESLIVPVLSGGNFYIDSMNPGEEATAVFRLDIDNNAEYKSYVSTLTINYEDETGSEGTIEKSIGIPVRGIPVIEILSAKVDNSDFKVDIENIGTGSAKALKIEFVQDGEVKDSSVVSELKPTRQKTLRFSGFRYGNAYVNISYLDESNALFSKETLVTVKASYSSEESGSTDMSGAVGVLLILVLAESYYIWRLRKRLKKR